MISCVFAKDNFSDSVEEGSGDGTKRDTTQSRERWRFSAMGGQASVRSPRGCGFALSGEDSLKGGF